MAPPSFAVVVDYDDIATQLDNAITRISQDPNRVGPLLFLPPIKTIQNDLPSMFT